MDVSNRSDFNMCCRLCLSKNSDSVKSILDDRSLHQELVTSVGVEVRQGDTFPTMICKTCVNTIKEFNKFKQRSLENQLTIEQWYHQNSGNGSDSGILIEYKKKSLLDNDIIMMPVISNVQTVRPRERPGRSSIPICDDEKEKDEKVINSMSMQEIQRQYKKEHASDTLEDTLDYASYPCPDCGGTFSIADWEKHKETHKKQQCEECGKEFLFQAELEDHHRRVHLNSNAETHAHKSTMLRDSNSDDGIVIMCEICETLLISKKELERHKLIHDKKPDVLESGIDAKPKNMYQYHCSLCPKSYANFSSLYSHNKRKHPENQKLSNRRSTLPIAPNLQPAAPNASHVKSENAILCKHCNIMFATLEQLKIHINTEHLEERKKEKAKLYSCNVCQKTFRAKIALYSHEKKHEREQKLVKSSEAIPEPTIVKEEVDKVFQCNTCSLNLPNDTALQTHILEKHRNVSCVMCNLVFSTQEEYDGHNQQFHTAVERLQVKKNYSCSYCSAVFTSQEEYSVHIVQSHNFPCDKCDKVFDNHGPLNVHLSMHLRREAVTGKLAGKAPRKAPRKARKLNISCSICDKLFQSFKDLKTHIVQAHPFNDE